MQVHALSVHKCRLYPQVFVDVVEVLRSSEDTIPALVNLSGIQTLT